MSEKTAAQHMLALVNVTNELLRRFQEKTAKQESLQQAIRERIPEVVDALVQHERIFEHEKEAAARSLEDPLEALRLLEKLAKHRTEKEAAALGEPYGSPTPTNTSRVLGSRVRNWDETEAGRAFREALLG